MRRSRRAVAPCRLPVAALLLLATSASAGHAQRRLVVLEEPASTAVGVAVVLNAGSVWEAEDELGITRLAALALVEELRPQLEILGARTTVECNRATVGFTLLMPTSTWRAATELFLDRLFDYHVGDAAISRARAELLRTLSVEQSNPAFDVRDALQRALYGANHRWARPACGKHETIVALPADAVRRFGRARFAPTRTAAAVAGPVSPSDAPRAFRALGGGALSPLPRAQPQDGRQLLERGTVTTWVALGFPFIVPDQGAADDGEEMDGEALQLLTFYLRDLAAPSPARPEVYDVAARLARHGGGGILELQIVTTPDRALDWANRMRDAVDRLAAATLSDVAFETLLRRYSGERFLALATPEARARDAARQLIFEHGYRPPATRIDALTPERLRRAAASLGPPASALLGPVERPGPSLES